MVTYQAFLPGKARTLASSRVLSLMVMSLAFSSMAHANSNARIEQYLQSDVAPVQAGNVSVIRQIGNNNRTTISQSYSAQYQNGNFSSVRQTGNYNTASITQAGGNNTGFVSQNGDHHVATINQAYGRQGLEAFVSQTGSQSDIAISQSGSGYRAINVQQQAFSGNARPVTVETY